MKTVKSKKEVFNLLRTEQEALQRFGIKKIALFGSYVKNKQKKSSDIDFIVEFKRGQKNYDNFIQTAFFLEKLYGKKVELVTKESISPYIKPHILKEMKYVPFTP